MRDRDLVRLHWPPDLRPAFDALFEIDDVMASVVSSASQPALGAIKLAWWRDALHRLDSRPPPAEPRLQSAAAELLPRGITGAELAKLEEGWAALLQPAPDPELVLGRGAILFHLAGRLLGHRPPSLERAGVIYAAGQLRRLDLMPGTIDLAAHLPLPRARRFRPLTAMARLALRDLQRSDGIVEPEATPGRSWLVLKHRVTGR